MLARSRNGKRSFFLLIVIKSRATVTSAKLISLFTKMAKRKMDNRSFQYRWEADYLLPKIKDRPVCLVCEANVAVTKEYETKHCEKYKDLGVKQKLQKVKEMKKCMVFPANYVDESKIKK